MSQVVVQLAVALHHRRKFEGSIRDEAIETFHWHNPSGRTMTLVSIKTLT
jgi:hypothetical protein